MNLFSFLITELSSSSNPTGRLISRALSNISFYRDTQGRLIPLIAGSFHYVAANEEFVIGISMDDSILAIYDSQRRQVLVRRDDLQNVVMTIELHEEYDEYFGHLRSNSPPHSSRNQRRRHH